MGYMDIIKNIEDELIEINKNFYYHAFKYDKYEFINMVTYGIKSPILLGKAGNGNNGNFYISLSKNEECENNIYIKLSNNPMFIINPDIKTIKVRNFIKSGHFPNFFMPSPFPLRESEYDNEYQKFLKVKSKDIIGIGYNLSETTKDDIKIKLSILKQMIEILESKKISIPIFDISSSTRINERKVLSLNL